MPWRSSSFLAQVGHEGTARGGKLARVRRGLLTAGVAACGVLIGCGGDGETTTVTVGDAGATQTQAAPRAGSAATTPAGEPAASDGPALASRAGTIDGVRVTLEIAELKRSGATTALSLRLTTEADERAQVAGTFDNGIFDKSRSRDASSISGGSTLDGVFLLDTKNRKKYLVGRDAENNCACDGDLGSAFVDSDGPLTLSATFGAPPADVRAVDVFVPKFGTFKDVPLGS